MYQKWSWNKYRPLVLILLKVFENASMKTIVIILKRFTWKRCAFAYKEWKKKKKNSKEAKRQKKRSNLIRKNHIDKNKAKEGILCEAGALYTVQGIF